MAKKKINKGEELFAQCLGFAGYPYEREYKINPNRRWRCDFFIPFVVGIVVEIEGLTYGIQGGRHQTAQGYTWDCEKYNWIVSNGNVLFRFTPAMVQGKAKSSVKPKKFELKDALAGYIEPAIDTLDRFVLKERFDQIDRSRSGYITPWFHHAL